MAEKLQNPEKLQKTEEQWRRELPPEQYHILREKGTEPAFSGEYAHTKTPGVYKCAACGQELFSSDTKYDSGSGWPSFYQPSSPERVETHEDNSYGMRRVEVMCSRCESHLGHVFPDGPRPTGMRFCINSASLKLEEKEPEKREKIA
jgi:peptide-methionine (R)-S-oxide reductase